MKSETARRSMDTRENVKEEDKKKKIYEIFTFLVRNKCPVYFDWYPT